MGSGKISFNGCFHDMPWGLQTHIYAPLNIDLKNRYRIAGNQPGVEPPEQLEIGLSSLGAPSDGLYLRDDVEIKCNVGLVSFVKAQLKAASKEMVSRIIKKAELLDAGVLHAMIENGKLRTINPRDRSTSSPHQGMTSPRPQQPSSPTYAERPSTASPAPEEPRPYQVPRPASYQQFNKVGHMSYNNQSNPHWSAPYGGHPAIAQPPRRFPSHAELPVADQGPPATAPGTIVAEMPGDYSFPRPFSITPSPQAHYAQPSPTYPASEPDSNASRASLQPQGNDWRWSQSQGATGYSSRRTSFSSERSAAGGMHSPGLEQQGFTAELPTHNEDPEESTMHSNAEALRRLELRDVHSATPPPTRPARKYHYNPADYIMARRQERERKRSLSYGN